MNLEQARAFALDKLEQELAPDLHYHSLRHTQDVIQAAQEIGHNEGCTAEELTLLQTAAAFHDIGFVEVYRDHEEKGCEIAQEVLPQFDYTAEQIEEICSMIMATKVPQNPQNKLGRIICDADLDYLGRDDFYTIGNQLFEELHVRGILENEEQWNRLQIKFLEAHQYFTAYSKNARDPQKKLHLKAIEAVVAGYDS